MGTVIKLTRRFHPDPASKQSAYPLRPIHISVYTLQASWWWTGNLSETCKVLIQKKIWEISAPR